ncbi:MAG TPA: acetylxylan esterase [Rubrobacteraceae bacterium]|jgi:cephalosporin-C deacetylase|nr:acetylxylan esterase [Rubrobacteraceae bacterium]
MESRPPKANKTRLRKFRDRSAEDASLKAPLQADLGPPPDFQSFWAKTRAEVEKVPLDMSREPFRTANPALLFERLTFGSLGGVSISGYALRWRDDAERPLVVHSHGYGGDFDVMWHWAERGVNVLGVEVRGYGRSKDALPTRSPWGYVLTGIESPQEYVLRGAVCDYVRAAEVGKEFLGLHTSRTVLTGVSFAGGLAVMAEAILQAADLLAVAVPSLGWVEGRRLLASKGSWGEIDRYLEVHPEREEALMDVLRYFDPMNFAPRVRCPTLVSVALADDVVPAPTVYAIAEHLGGPREVVTWPASHADLPEEDFFRERFEAYWLQLAVEGVPAGFGAASQSP